MSSLFLRQPSFSFLFRDFPRLSDALQAYSNRPLCTFLWSALENLTIAQRQAAP